MRIVNIEAKDDFVKDNDITFTVPIYQTDEIDSSYQTMTGWTLVWKLFDQDGAEILSVNATAEDYDGGTDNAFQWVVADDQTDGASPAAGLYKHEGKRTDAGNERTLFQGDVHLLGTHWA